MMSTTITIIKNQKHVSNQELEKKILCFEGFLYHLCYKSSKPEGNIVHTLQSPHFPEEKTKA